MRIDPLMTRSPATGARRHVTDDLLAEVYLAPRQDVLPLVDHLADRSNAPWSESFAAAPEETARGVETGLMALAHATPHLDPADIVTDHLPQGRARSHLTALRDLWADLGHLPGPLTTPLPPPPRPPWPQPCAPITARQRVLRHSPWQPKAAR